MPDRGLGTLPRAFGRYTLTALLGQGGMGRVYRATLLGPSGFKKEVALKVILARDDADAASVRESFVREARVCGLLRHPNVVDVYDFGVTDDQPWLAMELVDGWPLDTVLREHPLLPPTVALDVAIQIGEGLMHAHELVVEGEPVALIHRDLKPGNVIVNRQGGVKVMDFGLARATRGLDSQTASGVVRGTPAYMSPEQAGGEELDPRSDLFSFGILLYELAVGRRPFLRDNLIALIMALISVEESLADPAFLAPAEQRLPGISSILSGCLRRDPADRFDRTRELVAALRALLRQQAAGPSLRSFVDATLLGNSLVAAVELGSMGGAVGGAALAATLAVVEAPTVGTGFAGTGASQGIGLRTNLAHDPSAFVGREADLEGLGALVDGGARLVTLVGSAGTGKTRLARRFAAARLASFAAAGGIWFCDLAGARDGLSLIAAVAGPLGVPLDRAGGESGAIDQVGFALAGRGRVLLLLDNVEQVLEAARPLFARWSTLAPDALLLVTSRERLRCRGEQVVDVGPLPDSEGVQLFRERARAVRPDFAVTDEVAPVVGRIVRQLDGIPLAIELAAARCSVLSPEQILERLSERFKLLRSRRGGAPDRQATLQDAIEWSWNLLTPGEQEALLQCAVFAGSFDLPAVEQIVVLDDDDLWALDAIEALRDKSLVRAEQVPELGGAIRFRLYESIRLFASGRLQASGHAPAVEARHSAYYLAFGEKAVADLGGAGGRRARRQLHFELDNLHAIFTRAAQADPAVAARAVLVMTPVLLVTGPLDGHVALVEEAVRVAAPLGPGLRARLLRVRGDMRRIRARYDEGEADLLSARALAEEAADRVLVGEVLSDLCRLRSDRGAVLRAEEAALELTALADGLGDRRLQAAALGALGRARSHKPEQRLEAQGLLIAALRAHEELDLQAEAVLLMQSVAVSFAESLRHGEATVLFRQAHAIHQELGNRRGQASTLANLGLLSLQVGAFEEAESALQRSLRMHRRLGDRRGEGILEMSLGIASALQGRLEAGVAAAERSVELLGAHGSPHYLGNALRSLGTLLHLLGRVPKAEDAFVRAIAVLGRDEGGGIIASAKGCLAALCADEGRLVEADLLLAEAECLALDRSGRAFVSLCRGHVELAQAHTLRGGGDEGGAAQLRSEAGQRHAQHGQEERPVPGAVQEAANRLASEVLAAALRRYDAQAG